MVIDVNKAARAYLKMREARVALAKQYKKADADLRSKQEVIEGALLKFLNDHNMPSAPTEDGTFYKQEDFTPTGADWEAFYAWVAENNAFEALEKRIKKTFIKDYMDANAGAIPPGVSVFRRWVIRVRRNKNHG